MQIDAHDKIFCETNGSDTVVPMRCITSNAATNINANANGVEVCLSFPFTAIKRAIPRANSPDTLHPMTDIRIRGSEDILDPNLG